MKGLLTHLSSKELALGKKVEYRKGQVLFHEGEACQEVGFVLSGMISILSYSYQGEEILYNEILPGSGFGMNLLFSEDVHYKGDVIAEKTPTAVILFDKSQLLSLLQSNPAFLEDYLSHQSEAAKEMTSRIRLLSFPTLEQRLLYALHEAKGELAFSSIASLARVFGSQRETLSRLLGQMEKEGKIKREKKKIRYNGKTPV